MSTFMDRRLVTFLLFCVAFYVMTQIVCQGSEKENMESDHIQMQNIQEHQILQEQLNQQMTEDVQPIHSTTVPVPASASEEIFSPIVNNPTMGAPVNSQSLQELQGPKLYTENQPENWYQPPPLQQNVPQNFAVENTFQPETEQYFQTPGTTSGTGLGFNSQQEQPGTYYPDPVDVDVTFGPRQVTPQDLVQNPDGPSLFSEYQEQPSLNQNFLLNRFSLGISTTKEKRNSNLDLRGAPSATVPLSIVSPWGNPSILPDFYRKNLVDIS